MSFRCCSESLTRRLNVINTTFREKTYSRWCCIDRLSWQGLSECGNLRAQPKFRLIAPATASAADVALAVPREYLWRMASKFQERKQQLEMVFFQARVEFLFGKHLRQANLAIQTVSNFASPCVASFALLLA
jgi:hypothetical protein